MHILTDWAITRSGANIRVGGIDQESGQPRTIAAKKVYARSGRIVGFDRDGIEFQLAL